MGIHLEQSQKQGLSHKTLQSAGILQMNAQELTELIKELSLENPVVEIEDAMPEDKAEERVQKLEWLASLDEQNRTYYQYDKADTDDYLNNLGEDKGETLKDVLMLQVIGKGYSDLEMAVFAYIADSLDASGYYTEPLKDIACRFGITEEKAAACLKVMKGLEPAGVCASSLQESLANQVAKLGDGHELELEIISNYMGQLGKNQLPAIAKKTQKTLEQVKTAAERIKSLNPRPAQGFGKGGILRYADPDVTVVKFRDRFEILQNSYMYPVIRVNQEYLEMLKTNSDQEVQDYLTEKLRQAEQVQKAVEERGAILLNLAKCLLKEQEGFFLYGQKSLRPFTVKEASEQLSLPEITVSRAVKGKYLQCSWGIYPFRYFFSRGTKRGEEGDIPEGLIKGRLRELLDGEDKHEPYPDQRLKELLEEDGIEISRRTVMKYRESMKVANSRERKQF